MRNFNKIIKRIHGEKDFSVVTRFVNLIDENTGCLKEPIIIENIDQFNFTHTKSEISKMVAHHITTGSSFDHKLMNIVSVLPSARTKKSNYI